MRTMFILVVASFLVWLNGCTQSELVSRTSLGGAAECARPSGVFEPPINLGPVANSQYHEGSPCISSDGLTLYFDAMRPDGAGDWDVWVTNRETVDSEWGEPEMLPSPINTEYGTVFSRYPPG